MDLNEVLEKIGIDFKMVVFNSINFALFIIILNKFLFAKIAKAVQERQKQIEESIKFAEDVDKIKGEINSQAEGIISEANRKANEIVLESEKNAQIKASDIIDQANLTVQKKVEKFHHEMKIEKGKMIEELKESAADLSIEAAKKIVGDKIDGVKDKEIIKEYLKNLDKHHDI